MKKISKKEFFRLLINGRSAKLGAPVYPGFKEITDELVEEVVKDAGSNMFRRVIRTQSNALMFEDESWFFFSKPKNCDSRTAYLHEVDGKKIISLVDHRPAYKNQFGTPIREQIMVLVYELEI